MTPAVSLVQSVVNTVTNVGQTLIDIAPSWGWLGLAICFAIWALYDF